MITFGLGVLAGLVLIQFYPKAGNIGKWIVTKTHNVMVGDDHA